MKNLKAFESFSLNEAKTLFGDTVQDRANKIDSWAKEQGWKTEISNMGAMIPMIPSEVQELWNEVDTKYEKGSYKTGTLKIWGKFNQEIPTHSDMLKNIANVAIGKEKGWQSSPIKMIAGASYDAKKSQNKAQTFFNPALGVMTVQVKTIVGRRNDPDDFIIFVYFLKDEKKLSYGASKDVISKIDDILVGLPKKDKIEVIRHLKDKYADFTDSI